MSGNANASSLTTNLSTSFVQLQTDVIQLADKNLDAYSQFILTREKLGFFQSSLFKTQTWLSAENWASDYQKYSEEEKAKWRQNALKEISEYARLFFDAVNHNDYEKAQEQYKAYFKYLFEILPNTRIGEKTERFIERTDNLIVLGIGLTFLMQLGIFMGLIFTQGISIEAGIISFALVSAVLITLTGIVNLFYEPFTELRGQFYLKDNPGVQLAESMFKIVDEAPSEGLAAQDTQDMESIEDADELTVEMCSMPLKTSSQ